jgi:hypothetical protein
MTRATLINGVAILAMGTWVADWLKLVAHGPRDGRSYCGPGLRRGNSSDRKIAHDVPFPTNSRPLYLVVRKRTAPGQGVKAMTGGVTCLTDSSIFAIRCRKQELALLLTRAQGASPGSVIPL